MDNVFSWASHIIDKLLLHIDIDNYVGIERTILTLSQFAFVLIHKTPEYKYDVYTGIRDRLCKTVNLADDGAYYKVKNVFGDPKVFGSSAIQDVLDKAPFNITSVMKQFYNPVRSVDDMIFPFYATYVLKNIEYDGGYEEYELDQPHSYGNGRSRIEQELVERNGGSTHLLCGRPRMYYTEYNDTKTKNEMLPKISMTCGLGTVSMHESGYTYICDVDIVMEIQIDSMFNERTVAFVDYLSRILNLTTEEMDLFRKEILSKAKLPAENS